MSRRASTPNLREPRRLLFDTWVAPKLRKDPPMRLTLRAFVGLANRWSTSINRYGRLLELPTRRRRFSPAVEVLEDRVQLTATVTINAIQQAAEPSTTGGFRFLRSDVDLSQQLTVNYSVAGSASGGADYSALTGSIPFPPFISVKDLSVDVIDDLKVEGPETVVVTLTSGTGYEPGDPDKATVTIT